MKEVGYWDCFKKTGSIQDYLNYRQENSVKAEDAENLEIERQKERSYAGTGHTDGYRTEG